jgi:hypothetical protein
MKGSWRGTKKKSALSMERRFSVCRYITDFLAKFLLFFVLLNLQLRRSRKVTH